MQIVQLPSFDLDLTTIKARKSFLLKKAIIQEI